MFLSLRNLSPLDAEMNRLVVHRHLRLPLEGRIDLTYRCNNNCLHCWVRRPADDPVQPEELSFDEIRRIAGEARALGCRRWSISGGEPMLRHDFPEIFDFLTSRAIGYSINTNGTLITPSVARLLKRRGTKMISVYGATPEVYDGITRNPGGFERMMRGLAYMKEAGAGFIVQLIPMRANWHQWGEMIALAQNLSPHWRVGAPWLYLSADASPERNAEIDAQRLDPAEVIGLDRPNPSYGERMGELNASFAEDVEATDGGSAVVSTACGAAAQRDDRLFARCIEGRRSFHVDPYGMMSWCSFVKDPALRCDLRAASFEDVWERFIPSCADKVRGGTEWLNGCGSCKKKGDCRWCAVYSYLETGRYGAPVPYLCRVADQARSFKDEWRARHRRYFRIAGITVRLESDLDFGTVRFKDELNAFSADGPGDDNVMLRHFFEIPDMKGKDLGEEIYCKPPWAISRKNGVWFYRGISPRQGDESLHRVAVFSPDHRHGTIYSPPREMERVLDTEWQSLSLFPTDQIWLVRLLADRDAALLHSAAAVVGGCGFVFVGHSDAGKSTTMELLKSARREQGLDAEILCDDRNIVRKWSDGWRVHGTWSHGTTADVSPSSAPLRAVLFLEQAAKNEIVPLTDRKLLWRRLLATLIRAAVSDEWWRKELDILESLVAEVPCYTMRFDKTGKIVPKLEGLLS